MKIELLPGDEVIMTLDREDRSSLLTDKGSVSVWLWVITGAAANIRAVLHAILPCDGGVHRATTLEVIFPQGDLAKVYHWLQDNNTAYALCHGLNLGGLERIKKLLHADLAHNVRLKAGELGQRPGIKAGLRQAAPEPEADATRPMQPIALAAMPEKTEIFSGGEYREIRVS